MNKIESLADLFNLVGCDVSYYDLGRCISKITPQQAIQFDQKQQAYPFPFRQHAWLACLLRNQATQQKDLAHRGVIWFVKLPLDETGSLNLATRDHFIKTILDKILHRGEEAGLSVAMEDSPYAFKPDQERMASFHAILGKQLNTAPSDYFNGVLDYLGAVNLTPDCNWQDLGLQGIAELAARADEAKYQTLIHKALTQAARPFVSALCHALEHQQLTDELHNELIRQLQKESDLLLQSSYLRAMSRSDLNNDLLLPLFALLGNVHECQDEEIHAIAALAAKCPHWLAQNPQLLRIVMEKLAHRGDGFIAFKQITTELSQHPETKPPLWALLRSERISSQLAQAVGHIFTQTPKSIQ